MSSEAKRIRDLVTALADVYRDVVDVFAQTEKAKPMITELLEAGDLRKYGATRRGHHVESSQWLYYDTDIGMIVARHPKDKTVPVHDHGTWELVVPWTGRVDYRAYRRVDDGAEPGRAVLDTIGDRVVHPGEVEVVDHPPGDIHGWRVMDDDTWLFAIMGPGLANKRKYYDPESGTYEERLTKAVDAGAA